MNCTQKPVQNGVGTLGDEDEDFVEMSLGAYEEAAQEFAEGGGGGLQKISPMLKRGGIDCSEHPYTPALGSPDCSSSADGQSIVADFGSCTAGFWDQFTLSGQVLLAFDSAATCNDWISGGDLPQSGSLIRTSDGVTKLNNFWEYQIKWNSLDHSNYKGESLGGGVMTTFGANVRNFEIAGLHRQVIRRDGVSVRGDQSVQTESDLVVLGSRANGDLVIQSGTILVNHNILKVDSKAIYEDLAFSKDCDCPVSGKLTKQLSSENFAKEKIYDFNTGLCGKVTITKADGRQLTKILRRCQP